MGLSFLSFTRSNFYTYAFTSEKTRLDLAAVRDANTLHHPTVIYLSAFQSNALYEMWLKK